MKPIEQLARAMCNAQDLHLKCTYPECGCTLIEPAVKACLICLIEMAEKDSNRWSEQVAALKKAGKNVNSTGYDSYVVGWLKTMLEAE